MKAEEIQNLIKQLIEKTGVTLKEISVTLDGPKNMWVTVIVAEPHFYLSSEGEGLHALNHLVHRIIENKMICQVARRARSVKGTSLLF